MKLYFRFVVVLLLAVPARAEAPSVETVNCGFALAAFDLVDVDGDGVEDLLAVGRRGEVRVWRYSGGLPETGAGSLVLTEPSRTLMAVDDVLGTGGAQLALLTRKGLIIHRPGENGGFSGEGMNVARRAKFKLRVGAPQFTRILPDVNNDGRPDLLVPELSSCELWINDGVKDGAPEFRKTAEPQTDSRRVQDHEGEKLSDQLFCGFWVPYVRFQDVNGDGRPDLVVVDDEYRGFHLQRDDGTIPQNPDITLDLDIFRDTTPEANVRPGKTLAGGEDASLSMQDLDHDGIPDYVIAHRRKLWIFHGTDEGPQFTKPTTILKVAEDVTALLVVPLDGDAYPDLLLLRVQVPTVATLLKGLFTELDVDISASGYSSKRGKSFSNTPDWRGEIVIRLPQIMGILKNPDALIRKFEDTASKFRASVTADFDGNGTDDVAMVSDDGENLEVWKGIEQRDGVPDPSGLRNLFFEAKDRVWTIDRVLTWLGGLAERRAAQLTEGRGPDLEIPLRESPDFRRFDVTSAQIDGRSLLVVVYHDRRREDEGLFDFFTIP